MVSSISTIMPTAGRASLLILPVSIKSHGIAIQERSCTWRRRPGSTLNLSSANSVSKRKVLETWVFQASARRLSRKEKHVCCSQGGSLEEDEETEVSEVEFPQDVPSGVGSSTQMEAFSRLPSTVVSEVEFPQDVPSGVGSSTQLEAFSRLPSTVPWDTGVVASTMFIFWAGFHVPLALGGLDIIAKLIPEQFVDPQTQAMSLVFVQVLELAGTMWLIQSTLHPFGPLPDGFHFRFNEVWRKRGWLPASATGLVILLVAIAVTASLTREISSAEVSSGPSAFTALLNSTPLARVAIYVAYCGLTPCLEEYVYRGFLLSFLGANMRWPFAVMVSAFVFSLSHFSPPGFISLFWVGCCLGTAYTWNRNLATSFVIHSLYNAIVLTKAFLYIEL